jgi:hypothetical protein
LHTPELFTHKLRVAARRLTMTAFHAIDVKPVVVSYLPRSSIKYFSYKNELSVNMSNIVLTCEVNDDAANSIDRLFFLQN